MAADNTEKDKKDNSFMMKLATLIVDKRKGFYLIFIVLCIFCVLSMNKVKDRKSTCLNSSHLARSRMPSSA